MTVNVSVSMDMGMGIDTQKESDDLNDGKHRVGILCKAKMTM